MVGLPHRTLWAVAFSALLFLLFSLFLSPASAANTYDWPLPRYTYLLKVNGRLNDSLYHIKVRQMQGMIAKAHNVAEAARCQLLTADLHYAIGCSESAMASYKKVIFRYPKTREAVEALSCVRSMYLSHDDHTGLRAFAETLLDLAPDSELGSFTCRIFFESCLYPEEYEDIRQILRAIAVYYANTQTADMAHFGIGWLYAEQGIPELEK